MNNHGRGNVKAQRKRRNRRIRSNLPPRQPVAVQLIDGNFTHYPTAYCRTHQAYLTKGLEDTHRCVQRQCVGYEEGGDAR